MRYDADHKAKTRQRVLNVAKQVIRQQGLASLGVAAVMKDAGLTHGGFYAHFPSRDALLDAAIADMLDGARARFLRITDGRSPVDALTAYLDMYLSREHRDSGSFLCPLPVLSADMNRLEPGMRELYARTADALARLMLPMIVAADPALETNPETAIRIARSVVSEVVGALSLARAIGATEQSDAVLDASRAALKHRLGLPAVAAGTLQ